LEITKLIMNFRSSPSEKNNKTRNRPTKVREKTSAKTKSRAVQKADNQ
jgi:hypothetical protein